MALPKRFRLASIGAVMFELKRVYRMGHAGEMTWPDANCASCASASVWTRPRSTHASRTAATTTRCASTWPRARPQGVSGTPTFFLAVQEDDGKLKTIQKIRGAQPFSALKQAIDAALAHLTPGKDRKSG